MVDGCIHLGEDEELPAGIPLDGVDNKDNKEDSILSPEDPPAGSLTRGTLGGDFGC